MGPRIQFAQSADGVSIAYASLGHGPALVLMPALLFSHLEKMWEMPQLRSGLERLAVGKTVVRYDNRGCGLSQREAGDYSLEAHQRDLEAVVESLGAERVALNAPMLAGPVAVAYAVNHSDRVSRLVLQTTTARSAQVWTAQAQALLGLAESDWTLFTETVSRFVLQWGDEDLARQAAPILRECVTQQTARRILAEALKFDVSALLPRINCPTLVIHNRQLPVDLDIARELAARIPGARLEVVENINGVMPVVEKFVGEDSPSDGSTPLASLPTTLSPREIEVLRLVASGKSNREIAEELMISRNTVDRHVSHILAKIGASNRAEAAAFAANHRLLS